MNSFLEEIHVKTLVRRIYDLENSESYLEDERRKLEGKIVELEQENADLKIKAIEEANEPK